MASAWNDRKWARVLSCAILLALLGYGAYLRLYEINVSLYDDEINTRERALQSAAYTLETRDFPLYYLAAKLALQLGDSEALLRLPSFIAGILSILAIYGLVRQLHSRTAGLVAAALMAFNPFHITYSDFARYYALLMFFTILTIWSLYLVLERGRWHQWLAYTISALLGLASHICFAPALAALNAGAVAYLLFDRKRGTWKRRLASVCLLACCTAVSSSFLIYRDLGPARFFKPAQVATNTVDKVATPPAGTAQAKEGTNDGKVAGEPAAGLSIVEAHQQRSLGGGATFTDPLSGEKRYVLTYYDYLEYLKNFFWTNTTWVWPLLILVGVWGIADLAYRIPAAALPLFFGLFITPIPLFFVSAKHWYHPRYFSFAFIFGLILIAIGLCVLPRFLSRALGSPRSLRLWRRVPLPRRTGTLTAANVLYVLLVLGLLVPAAPIVNEAYQTYPVIGYLPRGPLVANHRPEHDWRNLMRFVAQTVREGDQFLFMSPEDQHGVRYARYYLDKFLSWSDEEIHFGHRFDVPTEASMREFARRYPMSNFWCVGFAMFREDRQRTFLEAAGASEVRFWTRNRYSGLNLYYLGAPTANHITNGDFEYRLPDDLPEGIEQNFDAFSGRACVRISHNAAEGAPVATRYVALPVAPASYRLRNNGFEAWDAGSPTGWTLGANARERVSAARPGYLNGTSVAIAPAAERTVLQQAIPVGLAPGRTLEAQMLGKSSTPNNLHLVLRYQGPGYQGEQHAVHPGTGEWATMTVSTAVPADADPNSFIVEIWRIPGGEGEVFADSVELQIDDLGGRLEPGQPYVLSLMLRTEDLRDAQGSDQHPAGRVRLRWTGTDGKSGRKDLIEIHQDSEWRFRTASFVPGVDIPLDLKSLNVEIGLEQGSGTIWADQVQLERGTRPTPFTKDTRLPHDETLSNLDLARRESARPW